MGWCRLTSEFRISRKFLLGVIWYVGGVSAALCSQAATANELVVNGEYIIQRRASVGIQTPRSQQKLYSTKSSSAFFDVVSVELQAQSQDSSPRFVTLDREKVGRDCAKIRQDKTVLTCEPNVVRSLLALPNDPSFSSQWSLDTLVNSDINAPEAWNISTGAKSTLIGVIDSGIYGQHPDLAANLWVNPNDTADGLDNDGNGYVDDIFGVNTHFGDGDPNDCNGHGTHVSGIIGAVGNNNAGIAGINWSTSLIVASISMDCSGLASASSVIRAYEYFTDLKNRGHNIRVINASFGGSEFLSAEFSALARLRAADILLVAAAGNSNADSSRNPSYPANYELDNIINVGATGPTQSRAWYSNYGGTLDIAAPGGDSDFSGGGIYSTWSPLGMGGALYRSLEGTSMAAPMVTGAIGLVATLHSTLPGVALKKMVLDSATTVAGLTSAVSGGRFLNLSSLLQTSVPTDACPADPLKLEPGICGCGVADTDGNNNGRWDCLEVSVADVTPQKPTLKVSGRRVLISMQERAGVEYYVEAAVSQPRRVRKRVRTSYHVSQQRLGKISKPVAGASVRVRYAFRVLGTTSDFSYWSPYSVLKVRR